MKRAQARTTAIEKAGGIDRSAQTLRIEWFSRTLLGREAFLPDGTLDPLVADLPYQLLASLAGTLVEAGRRGADQAAFVVHAFHCGALDSSKVAANDAGFERFVALLPGGAGLDVSSG